jgi:ADP-heptose:LPS heptosyltransferase
MKILIVRFSSIGDIVLCSPVIRCLSQQIPGAELHFATKNKMALLLENNPYLHQIHGLGENWTDFATTLKNENFDAVIDLHNNLRSRRLCAALGVKKTYRFHKANLQKWLWVRGWTRKPVEHIVHRYMRAVSHLGVQYDHAGLDFFYPETELKQILPQKFTAYAVGGTWSTKRMPVEKIKELINQTAGHWVLLGDAMDAKTAESVQAEFSDRVLNMCGKLSLFESAEVLKKSQFVVTHDTGLMHIAAALRKPMTCIWGNTVPEFGMGPLYPENLGYQAAFSAEVHGLKCRPCSKIGFDVCPRNHFRCMREQNTQNIAASIPNAE